MKFERVWAMPNKRTFNIKPIKQLIKQETKGETLDLFPYPYKRDALQVIGWETKDTSVDTVLYDPPYSLRQLQEVYHNEGMALTQEHTQSYWSDINKHIARVLRPGGKCIKFGWNSGRIGRGFELTRVLLVCHGGNHNDTIVTVQRKTSGFTFEGEC